jgi:radical SAM superfamily enzyme YgiQ (UPF0313 family)
MIAPGSRPLTVKFILPALTEATSPYWRPIKYSLFPPLGLATLAAYLSPDDQAVIVDEHVEPLAIDDSPELVVIQVYMTNAYRAYKIADHYRSKGAFVCLGGLHVTSLPEEATAHADTIFLGPGEQTFPKFLQHFRAGNPERVYITSLHQAAQWNVFAHCAAISSGVTTIWCQIPSSSRADVRSIVTSVTRTHSFRVGEGSTRSGWTMHWLKSSACQDGISISSTIICLATDVLRTRCLMA